MEKKLKDIKDRIEWTENVIEANPELLKTESLMNLYKLKSVTYDNIKKIVEREDQ